MKSVARRIADGAVLRLIKLWLKAPIEERDGDGKRRMSVSAWGQVPPRCPPQENSEAPPAWLPTHDPALNSTRCSGDTIGERGVCAETGKNAGVPVRRSAIWVTRPRAFLGRFIFCQARVTPGAICLSNSSHLPPRALRAPTSALRWAPRTQCLVSYDNFARLRQARNPQDHRFAGSLSCRPVTPALQSSQKP
jgi:hypothetical protein